MSNALDSLYPVNAPESKKSAVRKLFEKVTGGGEQMQTLRRHAEAVGHGVREFSEAALVGGALGALHAADPQGSGNGLDIVVKKASGAVAATATSVATPAHGAVTVPADGVLAGVAFVASLATAGSGVDGISTDMRHIGSSALAVFSFRKGADLVAAKKRAAGKTIGGQVPSLVSLQREANAKAGIKGDMFPSMMGRDPIVDHAARLLPGNG